MKVRLTGWLALCCAVVVFVSERQATFSQTTRTATASLSQPEQDLMSEINQARANPQAYAGYLEKLKPLFKGKQYTPEGASTAFETQEGWNAVEDAIKFLRASKPLGPLHTSPGLCMAALTHVKDQSATGATGHKGADRMMIEDRVKPYGNWQGGIGENLAYGTQSARERLLTWLIDDGFATRGHRNRLMSDNYNVAGLSCGPHPEYGTMCALALAGGFVETGASKSSTSARMTGNATPAKTAGGSPTSNKSGTASKPRKY